MENSHNEIVCLRCDSKEFYIEPKVINIEGRYYDMESTVCRNCHASYATSLQMDNVLRKINEMYREDMHNET